MSRYGWKDLTLKFGIVGGNWYDISAYVDDQSMAKLKAMIEEFHPKGAIWTEKVPVGTKEWDGDISLSGLYDDTATSGPDALFNNDGANIGVAAKVAESYDGGTTWMIVSVIIMDYLPEPQQKGQTRFTATLAPHSAPTFTGTEPTGVVS
jgi:hypothetical protein